MPPGRGNEEAGRYRPPEVGLVDREACMGSGNCVYWAPEVFDLDDEGIAVVRGDPAAHEEKVRLAAENCPTEAIRVDGLRAAR